MSIDVTRARGELAQLWQALLERVLGSLASRSARSSEPEAPALQRLQQLRTFLAPAAAPGPAVGEPAAASAVPSLHELLQYQARLQSPDTAPGASAGTAVLWQQVQRGLLVVARLCRHSEWTLDHLLASGLARQARELALLGRFCSDASLAQQLALLEARLILLHAAALAPPAFQLSLLHQHVLALAHGTARGKADGKVQGKTHGKAQGHGLAALPCVTQVVAARLDPLGLQELEQLQITLLGALLVREEVSERSMIAVYRLSWVLQALGHQALADCGLLLYQLLVRHWQQRAVLSSPLVVLHQSWLQQVSTAHGATTEYPDTSLLLQLSPALAAAPWRCDDLQPLLQLPRQTQAASGLPLRQVPEHMAAMLHVLLQVQPAWFADRTSWCLCKAALWQELQLLEQGAAALRLMELETFCSGLLALHAQLELMLPADPWPADLLWRVHAGLVQMLDRAAL